MASSKQKEAPTLYRVTKIRVDWRYPWGQRGEEGYYYVYKTTVDYVTRKGDVTTAVNHAKRANAGAAKCSHPRSRYYVRVEVAPNPAFLDISEEFDSPEPPTEEYGARVAQENL